MRSKGHLRLILNASINNNMKVSDMGNKAVCFWCCNAASSSQKAALSESEAKESAKEKKDESVGSYAVRFRDNSKKEEFRSVIESEIKKMEKVCQDVNNEAATLTGEEAV